MIFLTFLVAKPLLVPMIFAKAPFIIKGSLSPFNASTLFITISLRHTDWTNGSIIIRALLTTMLLVRGKTA